MEFGFFVLVILLRIMSGVGDYSIPSRSSSLRSEKLKLTDKGKEHFLGTVVSSADGKFQRFVSLEVLKPINNATLVFYEVRIENSRFKGGGLTLCGEYDTFAGTAARAMRHFLKLNGHKCPITQLFVPETESQISLWHTYLPVPPLPDRRRDVFYNLSVVDQSGNALIILEGSADM